MFLSSQPETVDEQMFLTAALENKLSLVDKYLTDGGNPDAADTVSITLQSRVLQNRHIAKCQLQIFEIYAFFF